MLWETNEYGFGIIADTLQYSSMNFHFFYAQSTNAGTAELN